MAAEPEPATGLAEVLRSRPVAAALLVSALALGLELTPSLARFRLIGERPASAPPPLPSAAAAVVGRAELTLETEAKDGAPEARDFERKGRELAAALEQAPPVPLVDPTGRALDGFFRSLQATERKEPGAITRILHFGDSIIVSDYVSSTLRQKLQGRFGDAGHGFVLIANAWPAYAHDGVTRYATRGFEVSRIVGPYARDGFYGLGGVSFSAPVNTQARFGTSARGSVGAKVSRFSLYYLEQPDGGTVELRVDDDPARELSTAGPVPRSRVHEVRVADGPHELTLQVRRGTARLFGVVLERDEPGVVLDALGVQGARIRFMSKQDDAHFREQLVLRGPSLLIYEFGANESADGYLYPMVDYHRTMREVLERGRRALPESSCLVIGAMDRAAKVGEQIVSLRVMPDLLDNQKRAALDAGCAFFDTFQAMGGARSMPRWVKRGLGQADLTHPTSVGAELIGTWVYRALSDGYRAYGARSRSP